MKKLKTKHLITALACLVSLSTFAYTNTCKAAADEAPTVGVTYDAHVQNIGWQNWVSDGEEAGTDGKNLSLEALKINLTNAPSDAKILYQSHVQNFGWQDWVYDGAETGTDGKCLRLEAIRIKLENLPGYSVEYQTHVQNIGWQAPVSDGAIAGTVGQGLRVEAIRIRLVKNVPVTSIALNKETDTLSSGDSDTLTATITPSNASNKNINWTSSDNSIVSVDNSGKITAIAEGSGTATATITAASSDSQKTATCVVTVNKRTPITFKDNNLETSIRNMINKPTGSLYKEDARHNFFLQY